MSFRVRRPFVVFSLRSPPCLVLEMVRPAEHEKGKATFGWWLHTTESSIRAGKDAKRLWEIISRRRRRRRQVGDSSVRLVLLHQNTHT